MDKELIQGLNNLSEALQKIADILGKKEDPKSATGSALQMGKFDKQIEKISRGITHIKKDTSKLLNQQDTILKILQKKDKDTKKGGVSPVSTDTTPVATAKLTNKTEDNSKVKKDSTPVATAKVTNKPGDKSELKQDKDKATQPSKIKEGLTAILGIAAGIVAIGLAFKLIGSLNILTVLGLSVALPFIAIAFGKIANALAGETVETTDTDYMGKKLPKKTTLKKVGIRELLMVPVAMGAMGLGMLIASKFLSNLSPVGILQIMTSIGIAFAFSFIIPAFSQMANSLKTYSAYGANGMFRAKETIEYGTILKAVVIMPLVMMAAAFGIMLSSNFLRQVKPVGILQLFSTIVIAAAFGVMGYGIGQLIGAFKKIDPITAIKASFLMPLVLVAVSVAIMLSSRFLREVKPIGILQALSSIVIAGVFAIIGFSIGSIMKGFKKVDPIKATKSALLMPILFLAVSVAIMLSSNFLREVKPIGLLQALSSIAIAAVFTIVSFGIAKIIGALKKLELNDVLKSAIYMPIIFTSISIAIMLSSKFLALVKPISFSQFLSIIGISILFVAVSAAFVAVSKILKNLKRSDIVETGLKLIGIFGTLYVISKLVGAMPISVMKAIQLTAFTIAVAASTVILIKLMQFASKIDKKTVIQGGLVILAVALTIAVTSRILQLGQYKKFPSLSWALGVGLSIGAFALIATLVGVQVLNPFFYAGLGMILVVAGTILATSFILGAGKYNKFPPISWSASLILLIGGISVFAAILGIGSILIGLGLGVMIAIAGTIFAIDKIFSKGKFNKFPPSAWVNSSLKLFAKMGVILIGLSLALPFILLGSVSILAMAGTIFAIDKIFSKGKFNKFPPSAWVNSSLKLFAKMGVILIGLSLALPFILLGSVSILAMAGTILLLERIFNKADFKKFPSNNWVNSVTDLIQKMTNIFKIVKKDLGFFDFFLGAWKVLDVIKTISDIDKILSRGTFKKFPSSEWNTGVSSTVKTWLDIFKMPSFFTIIKEKIASKFGGGIDDLLNMVVKADKILSKGKFQKYPDKKWLDGLKYTLTNASQIVKNTTSVWGSIKGGISNLFGGSGGPMMSLKLILEVDKAFEKGNWKKYPNKQWIDGTIYALQKFKDILKLLSFSSFKDKLFGLFGVKNPLTSAVSNIEKLGKSFSKLAVAMREFSNSVKGIDAEKLAAIKSLSSNVVLMSLMDPTQFDLMMDKLEERAGVFSMLMEEIQQQKTEQKKGGGAGGGMTTVSTKKTGQAAPKGPSEIQILSQKVDATNSLLRDIASVVGSGGTLKTYLSSMKTEVTIGGSSHQHTKSDLRLKKIIKKIGVSDLGINIYLFTYNFSNTVYQGVIAQELVGTQFADALHLDKNGFYSVDYSKIDVEFKKHLGTSSI